MQLQHLESETRSVHFPLAVRDDIPVHRSCLLAIFVRAPNQQERQAQ